MLQGILEISLQEHCQRPLVKRIHEEVISEDHTSLYSSENPDSTLAAYGAPAHASHILPLLPQPGLKLC